MISLVRIPPCMTLRTYCQDGDETSGLFTQQLSQLLFGEGVNNETEDEEGRQDNTQGAAQEWVQTGAFVVRWINSARRQMKSGFNITFLWQVISGCLLSSPCTHEDTYLLKDAPSNSVSDKLTLAITQTEGHTFTCPSLACCWWWNK